ncbi:hypothetical protein HXZ62_11455 [Empedobacter falsenii]|uniref:DUF378 domain-containing protein n=1 Tax=Empedobacter falsenii TaxID=343874 RepID=A0A7H9DU90_9FLAO|nr:MULTISPECIES: hypothetical protein [Empedobacter]MDH2205936.1 hypothetical protein [Empedobacter sp. GD03644]MDM1063167.1 hypothetical protein [Empedobacter falsenii]MDM1548810.1 hypothetical protein [Empedobacter falsenii]MDM1549737.1 hypothetical protein [Empedobacter falsenii]QLL58773.1 hypothetical protein FH779_12015 [Empedobacter falsenii]
MKTIGTYMAIFGLLAIVLNFFNAVPRLLAWIYNWGEGVAWGIKIAFVIVGAILYFMGRKQEENIAN